MFGYNHIPIVTKEIFDSPQTQFDWLIYADATFAGLSVLIPLPMIDLAFETFFKGRMLKTIARRNGRSLPKPIERELTREPLSCAGCLFLPIVAVLEFLKRLYRTVLYFLTVKAATDQLSYYWHRAFLLNYMLQQGHLDKQLRANHAALALRDVLSETTTSPLTKLAQQLVVRVRYLLRSLFYWVRRREEDEVMVQTRQQMAEAWNGFADHLAAVAAAYNKAYQQHAAEWGVLERDSGEKEEE